MKKIKWELFTVALSIVGSLIYGSMRFAKVEERVEIYQKVQCDKNNQFINSMEGLTKSINHLTVTMDSLCYEIKFINFKNGLNK